MGKKQPLFEKGIWIKEQQGVLTMGSLDRQNKEVMKVSDALHSKLHEFESEMMDALYGEDREPFIPGILDMERLFKKLTTEFSSLKMELSFKDSDGKPFQCPFDPVYTLMKQLVISSTPENRKPIIHIKASIIQEHLCMVYQDSESISDPSDLASDFFLAKSRLQGKVQFKKAQGSPSYYDIMIPANS